MMAFGRHILIHAGKQGQEGTRIETHGVNLDGEGTPSLHVGFSVVSSSDGAPARADIQIFNPPERLVRDMLAPGVGFVSVAAGYGDQADAQVFAGSPVPGGARFTREAGDLLLTIEALSGGTRYRDASVALGRQGRVTARRVAQEIAEQAGWSVTRNEIDPDIVYPRGFASAGSVARTLEKIAAYAGVEVVYPFGDHIEFIDPAKTVPPGFEPGVRFSTKAGNLIGFPLQADDGRWSFDGLISPGLAVGKQVVLESPDLLRRNTYVDMRLQIQELSFKGSNYMTEFYVHGVGRRVS